MMGFARYDACRNPPYFRKESALARNQGWKPHIVLRRNGNADLWLARPGLPGQPFVASIVDCDAPRTTIIEFCKAYCGNAVFFRNVNDLFGRKRREGSRTD